MIMRILAITLMLFMVTACQKGMLGTQAGPPWQQWMYEGPPKVEGKDYQPLYVEGWRHGCESGTSASANQWYKFFYKFQQDAVLAQNRVYYKGWKDAFDYCQRYIYQYTRRHIL